MVEEKLDRKDLLDTKETDKAAQDSLKEQEQTLPPNRPLPQGTAPLSMEQIKARQRLLEQLPLKKESR